MRRYTPQFTMLLAIAVLGVSPFGGAVGAQQAAAGQPVPDFSGMWAHPSLPGMEPLASGPTSLTNLSRRNGRSNVLQLVGDYHSPILKPEAAAIVKKHGEESLAHYGFHNPRNQCWPNGLPFVLPTAGMQMFQHGDSITMVYLVDHQVRHVRLNAQHPANITPSWYGDSIGHYEGGTLVIDTVGIKPGPFAMIDWYGTPQSPAVHVVERYRLITYQEAQEGYARDAKENARNQQAFDPNYRGSVLQLLFTVDDPNVFTTPWSATVTYRRMIQDQWLENVCAENPHKYGTEEDAQVPAAIRADF
ncbi:MAG: hypothetical protein KGO48_09145 [Alphaproteobacteria bacterium]|nr:hypothetical protein [Alphaproteobacteria bacterium]